jgi:predicted phosphodiesterase
MNVAAIYDIHGNLPALETVLEEIRQAGVDQVVVGGDIFPGPMPRESLECLLEVDLPVRFITGNGDREVLALMAGRETDWYLGASEEQRAAERWTAQQLRPEHGQLLARWPATLRGEIEGLGEVLFCHATPRNDTEVFTRLTPEERLLPTFEGCDARLVVCGHTHMQFDRRVGAVRVLNAGSVGMAYGESGAYWLLLGPGVEFRRTAYDFEKAAERIRATDYPQADDFATRYVLNTPSEDEALGAFARMELK